jgi:O-antigen ligase
VIGFYLFAGTAVLSVSGAALAAVIMLLAWSLSLPRVWQSIRPDPVFWLVLACLVYVLCSALLAAHRLPETAAWQWEQAGKWAWLALLPVVAWWLRSGPRRFYIAFTLFAAGAFLRMALNTPWEHLGDLVTGVYRPWGFGLWHISFSAYLAIISLGLVLFSRRVLVAVGPGPGRWLVVAGILAALLLCGVGIVVGKSRGTWLAMVAVFPVIVLAYLHSLRRQGNAISWKSLGLGGAVLAVALAAGLGPGLEHVSDRLFAEQETYESLLERDVSQVPLSSVGTRIHLYKYGFERWLERPVFGWGAGSEAYLIESTGLFTGHYRPPHFHNIVLEILVRFGLVGLLLVSAVFWLIYRDIWRAYRSGRLPADWFYFFVGTLAFSLVWGMADIRVVKWDYRYFTLLFLGAAYALTRYHADERFFARINDRSAPPG